MKKHRKSFVAQFGLCLTIALLASCGKGGGNKEDQNASQTQKKAEAKAPGQKEFDAGVELFNEAKELYRNGHSLLNNQEYSAGREMLEEAAKLFAAAGMQFSDAAELGNMEAIYYIGMCLDYGNYTSDTAEGALDYYRKAAEQGNPDAQFIMGKIYFTGRGYARELINKLTDTDPEKGMEWWKKAAAQGHAESLYQIALLTSNSEDVKSIPLKDVYENFRKAAEKGHAKAQYCLGLCYFNGWGVEKNLEQAVKWFKAASDQGELNAKNRLGECYYSGEGVAKDQKKAFELFKAAADEKNREAMCNLGICYVEGGGTTKDVSKGWRLFNDLRDLSPVEPEAFKSFRRPTSPRTKATFWVGKLFALGYGDSRDSEEQAYNYLSAAANRDDADTKMLLEIGEFFETGNGVKANENTALNCYLMAASKAGGLRKGPDGKWSGGNVLALSKSGLLYMKKDYKFEAVRYLIWAADQGDQDAAAALAKLEDVKTIYLAAEAGDPDAQFKVGCAYLDHGSEGNGYGWIEKAAKNGNEEAPIMLGDYFKTRDKAKAQEWYAKAVEIYSKKAEKGDPMSQYMLAKLIDEEGIKLQGVDSDAGKWYQMAVEGLKPKAENGDSEAQMILGRCYDKGKGVEKSEEISDEWYKKAREGSNDPDFLLKIGREFYEKEYYLSAARSFKKASDLGNPEAAKRLDDMRHSYRSGVSDAVQKAEKE